MIWKRSSKHEVKQIIERLLSFIINDPILSQPLYMPEIDTELEAEDIGIAPVICVWNENESTGTFSVSINAAAIEHLLEGEVSREHKNFIPIRNEVINVLSRIIPASIAEACNQSGMLPSQLYGT